MSVIDVAELFAFCDLHAFYETRLRDLREQLRTLEAERVVAKATLNRALLGAMVDDDWLGSRLLAQLTQPMTVGALAMLVGTPPDRIAAALARLHRGGAVDVEGDRFLRTARGAELLARLEQATGVDLGEPDETTEQLRYTTEEEALAAHHEIVRRFRVRLGH
jgi:hypothetical protein